MNNAPDSRLRAGIQASARKALTRLLSASVPTELKLSVISSASSSVYREQSPEAAGQKLKLGFYDARVPPGTHICFFYTSEKERDELVFEYVKAGIESSERCLCAVHYEKPLNWINSFMERDFDLEPAFGREQLALREGYEFFFPSKRFDPGAAVKKLDSETRLSTKRGFSCIRLLLDISWANQRSDEFENILEYEQLVNETYYGKSPVIGMCLYDLKSLPDSFADRLIALHPYFIYKASFRRNPSFASGKK